MSRWGKKVISTLLNKEKCSSHARRCQKSVSPLRIIYDAETQGEIIHKFTKLSNLRLESECWKGEKQKRSKCDLSLSQMELFINITLNHIFVRSLLYFSVRSFIVNATAGRLFKCSPSNDDDYQSSHRSVIQADNVEWNFTIGQSSEALSSVHMWWWRNVVVVKTNKQSSSNPEDKSRAEV